MAWLHIRKAERQPSLARLGMLTVTGHGFAGHSETYTFQSKTGI